MKIPILVTGGAGYIGSMVCKVLANKGYHPIAFDNLSVGHKELVKWGPLHIGDIKKMEDLDSAFETYQPKCVIHLAASAYVVESIQDPDKYYTNNVLGTIHLLEAMRKHQTLYLLFSSSCATYGIPEQVPITEKEKQKPITPYGRTKWMGEQIIQDFEIAYSIKTGILRYFNAAGADPDLEIGEIHDPETHLIPLTILTALKRNPVITIYGDDFPTQDGTAVRDYIHVQDLAEAHVLTVEHLLNKKDSVCLNLGTGTGSSVKQIIQMTEKIISSPVSYKIAPKRKGEPPILVADSSLSYKTLQWQPKYSDLQTIVDTAYQWQKKYHRL